MLEYINPRKHATIVDWPRGSRKVTAIFEIESNPKRGERATRTTTGAVKKLPYAKKARIVDGSDGRTYIIELSTMYGQIIVMRGDMKYMEECIYPQDPRFGKLRDLFES